MSMISILRINIQDTLYQQERELRNKVLMQPIGMPDYGWEQFDSKSWHFVAIDNKRKVVGCVVLVPNVNQRHDAQLIQMAVDESYQGKGVGKLLVEELETFAKTHEISTILCHSRDKAVNFYLKLNFEIYDEPFEEAGIIHRYMRKYLEE